MFAPSADTRVDWFRLLVDLKEEGFSLYSVSHFTEIPKSTLNDYKQGAEPRHSHGEKLLYFWSQVTGQQREQAPTHNPFVIVLATPT